MDKFTAVIRSRRWTPHPKIIGCYLCKHSGGIINVNTGRLIACGSSDCRCDKFATVWYMFWMQRLTTLSALSIITVCRLCWHPVQASSRFLLCRTHDEAHRGLVAHCVKAVLYGEVLIVLATDVSSQIMWVLACLWR